MTSPSEEPAWKQRAVERSIKSAKLRAAQRVQRFLDAAQAIIIEKGSTNFTVQEVVDRSRQSLRSFYLQFDGKHELLLALFEDALSRSADQIRAATTNKDEPVERLKVAIQLLFESTRPDPTAKRIGARLAVPVVPVRLVGADRLLHQNARFPTPGRVSVRFGPPLHLQGEDYAALARQVEAAVRAL